VLGDKNVWKHCVGTCMEEMQGKMVTRNVDEDLSREALG
jgi:hypothetical protein